MDFSLYWFMLPLAIVVSSGTFMNRITGIALLLPIFLLLFPILGPQYLIDPSTAVVVAIISSTFAFSSGAITGYNKRCIDFLLARSFLIISIPSAIAGAIIFRFFPISWMSPAYGIVMLVLAIVLILLRRVPLHTESDSEVFAHMRAVTAKDGNTYQYPFYLSKSLPTLIGGLMSGLLSVGIGTSSMYQFIKHGKIALPVAIATSLFIGSVTMAAATLTHIATHISTEAIDTMPWHLLIYTIPGVIIGSQIGSWLQHKVPLNITAPILGGLFFLVGLLMIVLA